MPVSERAAERTTGDCRVTTSATPLGYCYYLNWGGTVNEGDGDGDGDEQVRPRQWLLGTEVGILAGDGRLPVAGPIGGQPRDRRDAIKISGLAAALAGSVPPCVERGKRGSDAAVMHAPFLSTYLSRLLRPSRASGRRLR